ncbi:Rpr2-domain-containing protein [Fomitiporia mediterranea MF3/22]|uniref:Rpr2-domain-containing protein n=1 Tax=Fomitiporia mediterranea (strain MF3/22) TaxID=694068 RepID=UPI0004407C83|nr:Rpr2-domain-containing protein [Fomitiporia mediterranea MF3/22]EJD03012.1 Rpr2-domain-containing protein [Fomitiporia mediterranea MF3/22]
MGKKNKDDTPNINSVPNRDIIQRLNFLYQASSYLNGLGVVRTPAAPSGTSTRPVKEDVTSIEDLPSEDPENEGVKANEDIGEKSPQGRGTRKPSGKRKATTHDLARSYVKSMKIIGQKTNVKMDPSVKRTLCKGCNTLLMPGVTAKVRVKPLPSHGHAVNYTCMHCSFSRRIPAPPITEQTSLASSAQITDEPATSTQSMDIDPVNALLDKVKEKATSTPVKDRKKRPIKPRQVPFFARAEHLIFVGNERVHRDLEGNEPN